MCIIKLLVPQNNLIWASWNWDWEETELGIEAPIHVSMKLGDSSNVYNKIVTAAEHPHLSIPKTKIGKKRNQYHRIV